MNILIVDDDDISRTKVAHILSDYGTCVEVENGQEALCQIGCATGKGVPFDLITMDIEMPGLSGHDVVKAIRNWEKQNKESGNPLKPTKIIMVTSKNGMKSIYTAHERKCDQYLVKPVTPEKIRDSLSRMECVEEPDDTRVISEACPVSADEECRKLKAKVAELLDQLEEQSVAMRRLVKECKQVDRAKEEFISTISHELRTPLTGILGMSEVLLQTAMDEDQKSYAESSSLITTRI